MARDIIPGYRLGEEIARTDRAIVYAGVAESSGDAVAVKLVQNDADGRHEVEMLRRVEGTSAGRPVHVVRLRDVYAEADDLFLVLEYFQEILAGLDPARMTPLALMHISLDSSRGLVEMERAGVVDDDVKPANIAFKADSGRVAHIDLGYARPAGERPRGYTPPYAAPEVMNQHPSETSPCFGWGRTMEFLTFGRVGLGPDYRLDQFVPWVGHSFAELVVRCGEPEPSHRPSVTALYAELKRIVGARQRCRRCYAVRFADAVCLNCGIT